MTAIRHVLDDLAAGRYVVPPAVLRGLEVALDAALELYADLSSAKRRA